MLKTILLALAMAPAVFAQSPAIDVYVQNAGIHGVIENLAAQQPGMRTNLDIQGLLPHRNPVLFAEYVETTQRAGVIPDFQSILGSIDASRLNKLMGSTPAGGGTTSLLSKVAAPAVLGFAVEHGGILQESSGMVTSVRGNLLGLSKLALGEQQFPYCPEIAEAGCPSNVRWLRRFSGVISFEDDRGAKAVGTASGPSGTASTDIFGNDFRMSSWGMRFDFTPSQNLTDPRYVAEWKKYIVRLREDPSAKELTQAVIDVFDPAAIKEQYQDWMAETVGMVQVAVGVEAIEAILADRLELLVPLLASVDANFGAKIVRLRRTFANYSLKQDELVRMAQTHKLSLEYSNLHPLGEPTRSNLRFIYSHQPTQAPAIITLNAAVSFYNGSSPLVSSRLRDVQVSGQLDRRLGDIAGFGNVVLTLAGYYQWMKDDALILIESGDTTPGPGIPLPGSAATLLGTKGSIGVGQIKVSLPLGGTIKIPLSVTWATRTELINEQDVRGQIGFTLDPDQLFD